MKKQFKHEVRMFVLETAVILLVLGISFFMYAHTFRGRTEMPVKYIRTNKSAAVYSLEKQMKVLSDQKNLMKYAFEGREEEYDHGTYIIPGLKSTRTLLVSEGTTQAICSSMTPQGMALTDKYLFISAYCHTGKHNSVIYMINRETHHLIKEIVLPGKPHAGGLAYDKEHDILWYSSNEGGLAQAISITMRDLEIYDYEDGYRPVVVNQICTLYGIVRDSFMTFYEGCLYVGCFTKYTDSVIARYAVDEEGRLVNTMDETLGMEFEMAVPLDYSTISEQAQGMAFYDNKLLISHSFGILPSRIVLYEKSDERLYINENSKKSYRLPERIEQIVVDGDDLYILFESAAYAYRALSVNIVDRVLKLSIPKMEEHVEVVEK